MDDDGSYLEQTRFEDDDVIIISSLMLRFQLHREKMDDTF
jgi:hypothetical protein